MERVFKSLSWNVSPFGEPSEGAALLLLLAGEEGLTGRLRDALTAAGAPAAWLAFPLAVDWDRDYTPWPAEGTGGRRFAGGAGALLESAAALRDALRRELRPGAVYPVGYSLGGLAALWLHACLGFDGAGSCSGSLWYPDFTDFLAAHPPGGRIYLSLGGREKNTRDPQMAQNPAATESVRQLCLASAQKVFFRSEPGGHFRDPEGRLARGAAWLCGKT